MPIFSLIIGSSSPHSSLARLLKLMEVDLQNLGVSTNMFDLCEYDLPIFKTTYDRNNSKIRSFIETCHLSDALIWASPVYHNSFSGIFKNAIDYLGPMPYKPVGFISSDGNNRGTQAVDQMLIIARSLHMIPTPHRICIKEGDIAKDSQEIDQEIQERSDRFCKELLFVTQKLN